MSPTASAHPAGDRPALLIIDMINDLEFEGAAAILDHAEAASHVIRDLRAIARRCGAPVIYVNDNFDRWSEDRRQIVERACRAGARGASICRRLAPADDDVFIIKPQQSGFYGTSLPVLLPSLGATRLVLVGLAADLCVLFTAADAHMRSYALWAPRDGLVPSRPGRLAPALEILSDGLGADTRPATCLDASFWNSSAWSAV